MFVRLRQPFFLLLLPGSFVAHHTWGETMHIQLAINDQRLQATLDDTASGRDFYALLPLTLSVEAYAATETIGYLPRKLTTQGAPAGVEPRVGDITYYAPWGNLALFIEGRSYSASLLPLGKVDTGLSLLARPGPYTLRIERARP